MKHAGLDSMLRLVAIKFEGKFDKGGAPYALHCLFVMNGVRHLGYKAMMVGLGHDLIEDTDVDVKMLQAMNFHPDVVQGISDMTHRDFMSYDEYLKQVYTSRVRHLTIPAKMSDLTHNMQPQRLKDIRPKDFERLTKYAKAYKLLEKLL